MKILPFVFSLLLMSTLYAQSPHFNQVELLRNNEAIQVNVVYPDRVGYLWVGTNKGLFRFDGLQSTQFKKSDGFSDEYITAIAQDSLGKIWCGHKNGEISIIENNKITKFDPSEGSSTGLISDILFDRSGTMWFSTNNDGLYYYKQERLYRIDENEGLLDLFFYDLEEDSQGNIWAGSDGGLAICNLQGSKVSVKVISMEDGLPDNIIHKIRQDLDGTFWLGTEGGGLIHYLPSEKKFVRQENLTLDPIHDLVLDGNYIWLATQRPGIILYDKVLKSTSVFRESGMPEVDALAKDIEGNIWYGTKNGLQQSFGNHISFLELKDELGDNNVFALASDSQGGLWFSTQTGLFRRHKKEDGNYVIEKPLKGSAFEKLFIISLYADEDGFIWAGSYGQGLLRININTKSVKLFDKELRNGNVLSITGKKQQVWLATLGGVTKIDWKNEQLEIQNIGSPEGLSTDYIYQVFIDSQQRVWLATDGKGVNMIDDSGIHHFSDSLSSKVIYGFAEDHHHTIWANVQHDGLYLLNGNKFRSLNDSAFQELRKNEISCLSSTQAGNLIMMNNFGLEVFDVQQKQHHYLGRERDFHGMHPNLNATEKDNNGNIYFGTEHGIVVYGGGVNTLPSSPVPYIESLKVANHTIGVHEKLDFNYQENNITFNYLGFWFQNPGVVSYKYQLENYDHEWITSRDRTATYSNLPPGQYTFRLKVSNSDFFHASKEASIRFIIRPPFWKTYWFYFLCAILLFAGSYSLIHYREKKLISDKHKLEAKVKERTAEILKMNHEIRHQAEEIKAINDNLEKLVHERTKELDRKNKALEEAAFINAHNLRSPVASILGLISLIIKLKWPDHEKEYVEHLEISAKRLDEVVSTITEAIDKGDEPEIRDDIDKDMDHID